MSKQFRSEFKKSVKVNVVSDGDLDYIFLQPLFEEYGYGFAAIGQNTIFIDGQYNPTIQKIVEAHEIAHIILKHTEEENLTDETEADLMAHKLLLMFGYEKEAKLLGRKFKGRNGVSLTHKSLDILKEKILKFLKKDKNLNSKIK